MSSKYLESALAWLSHMMLLKAPLPGVSASRCYNCGTYYGSMMLISQELFVDSFSRDRQQHMSLYSTYLPYNDDFEVSDQMMHAQEGRTGCPLSVSCLFR